MPLISEDDICMRCRSREYAFMDNFSLYEYGGKVREILHQYKFRSNRRLAYFLASKLARVYRSRFGKVVVVPVPGRRSSVRKRGWDQVDVIARILEELYEVPVLRVLRRDEGASQKSLDFAERAVNLTGKIHFADGRAALPPQVVLLDDVFTTGATGNECATVLRRNGAQSVRMLTVAID